MLPSEHLFFCFHLLQIFYICFFICIFDSIENLYSRPFPSLLFRCTLYIHIHPSSHPPSLCPSQLQHGPASAVLSYLLLNFKIYVLSKASMKFKTSLEEMEEMPKNPFLWVEKMLTVFLPPPPSLPTYIPPPFI